MTSADVMLIFVIALSLTFLAIARYDDMQEEKRQHITADK